METSTNLGRVSLVPRGEYDPAAQYERLDIVRYGGSGYLVLRTVQGVTPADGANYMLVAEKGGQGNKGDRGEAAGFGAVSATVDDSTGTPSVEVSASGPDTAKAFAFSFHGLKGKQGVQGEKGAPGSSIASIERTAGTGAPGTRDTYTITLTDGTTSTFQVYNGADGAGAGDMTAAVYDPQGKAQDIFKYVDDHTPKDAVTVPGGGEIEMGAGLGEGPYTFEFSPEADGAWLSNLNLIINWDFRRPVNRQGKTEYTATGPAIDCWSIGNNVNVSVQEQSVSIVKKTASVNGISMQQQIPTRGLLGETVTLSILTASGVTELTANIPDSVPTASGTIKSIGLPGIGRLQLWSQSNGTIAVLISSDSTESAFQVSAVKLELGSVQTLAHQDADGNWVLNDPPNYDLQYALCSLYSPTTGEWVGSQHSNPNLLDNPLFQINQRNITAAEYTGSVIRTVDRWEAWRYDVEVTSDGISIAEHTEGSAGWFRQMLDIPLMGKDVTFSALIDGELHSVTALSFESDIYSEWKDNARLSIGYSGQTGLYSAVIYNNTAAKKVIQATKLELGAVQTLAHQDVDGNWVLNDPPPDPALELVKCQRYLIMGPLFGFCGRLTANSIGYHFPVPVTMRAAPALIGKVSACKFDGTLVALDTAGLTLNKNTVCAYIYPKNADISEDSTGYLDESSCFSAEL